MCNHLKSRSQKQNVIQSRFNLPASQCIPVCGATFGVVRVHHHHVLILTKLGQALSVVVRLHKVLLPTSRRGLSPNSMRLVQDVARIQHARSGHLRPTRSIGTVRRLPFCQPSRTTCLSPSRQVVEDRAQSARCQTSTFYPYGSSTPLYASLWRGHFTDLPGFADVLFDCNDETCMSICPSSHPTAPLKKSVSSQHTVSHWRAMSTWSFGTGQENHVVCLKSEQDLFQSASLPRTRSKWIVGADLEHGARLRWARARVKNQNTTPQTFQASASKQVRNIWRKRGWTSVMIFL